MKAALACLALALALELQAGFAPPVLAQEKEAAERAGDKGGTSPNDETWDMLRQSRQAAPAGEEEKHVDELPQRIPHNNPASVYREIAGSGKAVLDDEKAPERSFAINDIVKVLVYENTSAKDSTSMDTKRDFNIDAGIDEFPHFTNETNGLLPKLVTPPNAITPSLKVDSSVERKNSGNISKTNTLKAVIPGRIVDVKPNGILVISAEKTILVNEEEQTLRLTGLVSKDDVTEENTVNSSEIAEMTLEFIGDGPISDANRRGLLQKLFDMVWPF